MGRGAGGTMEEIDSSTGGGAAEAPSSPVKQRGMYSEYLADVSDGLRQEAMQGPDASKYVHQTSISSSWEPKIKALETSVVAGEAIANDGLTRTTEPKLQVPFLTEPGQPPRQVVLERERRFYLEQNLEELILAEGIDFSAVGDPSAERYPSTMELPLALFDDTEFDCRTPEEWVGLGKAEDRGVPCKCLFPKGGEGGGSEWVQARVTEYDEEAEAFLVVKAETDAEKWAPRLEICFTGESPFELAKRLGNAFERRYEAEQTLRYNLYVDCMPTEDIAPLDQGQLSRMLANAMSTKSLRRADEKDIDIAPLLHEVNLDFMRTQSMFVLDAAVAAATASQAEEDNGQGNALDAVFAQVVIPESQQVTRKAAPAQGCVAVENDGFLDKVSDFTFASLLTQPKVVSCMARVRAEHDQWVLGGNSPLKSRINRAVSLQEWKNVQSQTTAAMTTELQEKWGPNIRNHIMSSLRDVGKGWFNLQETNRDIYEFSKLKRLLKLITFSMEDSIRFMMEETVECYASFIEKASAGSVAITGPMDVVKTDILRSPLFTLELIADDGPEGGLKYNQQPDVYLDACLEAYDTALTSTGAVEKVDHQVMGHLLRNSKGMLMSVSATEGLPKACRERVEAALKKWLPVVAEYLATYDQYDEFVKSTIQSHLDALTNPEDGSSELKEIQKVLLYHEQRVYEVIKELPAKMQLGIFDVNTKQVREFISAKHSTTVAALQDFVREQVSSRCKEICAQMEGMSANVRKPARSPEHAVELRQYYKEVHDNVASLKPLIAELPAFYDLLDEFMYLLPDDDDRLRWTTFSWPTKMMAEIVTGEENCDAAENEFQNMMITEQAAFNQEIVAMNNIVVGFAQHKDMDKVDLIATNAKTVKTKLSKLEEKARTFNAHEGIFGLEQTDYSKVGKIVKEFEPFNNLWNTAAAWQKWHEDWLTGSFIDLDSEAIEKEVNDAYKLMTKTGKLFDGRDDGAAQLEICNGLKAELDEFKPLIPLILSLRNPGMQDRHWEKLSEDLGQTIKPNKNLTLQQCVDMDLLGQIDVIEKTGEIAGKEYALQTALETMYAAWEGVVLDLLDYRETGTKILRADENVIQTLEDHITMTQAIAFSPFKGVFEEDIGNWDRKLNTVSEVMEEWLAVQRNWMYLEPIFSSDDINKQLPLEATRFSTVDQKWRKNMSNAMKNPGVVDFCSNEKLLIDFQESNKLLDLVSKGLSDYLETKRAGFARFYFLSNDELLEILSQTKDPRAVQPHLRKCFEAIASLTFEEDLAMIEMTSGEGEVVKFSAPLYPKGNVEDWLTQVQYMMKRSVRLAMKTALEVYYESARTEWVKEHPAMCVLNGSQYFWTKEIEEKLEAAGNEGVVQYKEQALAQIEDLINLVRGHLTKQQRMKVGALIVIEVHARDVITRLVETKVSAKTDFDWVAQMRYYWELRDYKNPSGCQDTAEIGPDLWVCLVAASQYYGYEYLGNSFRLVITPLTDRCYMTLMGAMHLNLGGAPAGPAGTGKTETTKDLAKALAKQCVVFNCSDGLDYLAMGKFFKGLASAGAWACFDEFNRIDIEVLSVIAQQMITIVTAIKNKQKRFIFEGSDIPLSDSFAVFITMNPGYAGRTELPDNLQAMFRPMSMMVPDYGLIGEIMFISFGFGDARPLAGKMVATFRLCSEQLSAQSHYDYGMRAVKTVITAGGNLKASDPDEDEEMLLLRALCDVNVPKFLAMDLPLFDGIIKDLFPRLSQPVIDYGTLDVAIRESVIEQGLQEHSFFLKKVIELFSMTLVRHGMMLVGPTGGGKTRCYKVLQSALTKLYQEEAYEKVKTMILNPKAITMGQMYGQFDDVTHEWSDGILANQMRLFVQDTTPDKKWIIFDGPVDAIWIENMNTVLDDNKKLCLNSGEIIKMSEEMTMMFEVEDLAVASPATVSRCGMIYMEPKSLGNEPLVQSWLQFRIPDAVRPYAEKLKALFDIYLEAGIFLLRRHCKEPVPTVDNNLTASLLNIMDCYLKKYFVVEDVDDPLSPADLKQLEQSWEPLFYFSLIWSIGCTTDPDGRHKFDTWLREQMVENGAACQLPADGHCYDYMLKNEVGEAPSWIGWLDTIDPYSIPPKAAFNEMVVPTKDNVCYTYLLQMLTTNKKKILNTGNTGTGKTVNILRYLENGIDPNKYIPLPLTFSAQTSANMTQDILDGKFDKRRKNTFGPPMGKQFLVLVDDMNMPAREEYGAQPPIEVLRQWMDHGGWYDRKSLVFWNIIDLVFIGAMGPPGGGKQDITPRFLRHFNSICYTEMKDESLVLIFSTILTNFLTNFPAECQETCLPIVNSTIAVYNTIRLELLPTPEKSHYTFNLRDLAKVIQGMLSANDKRVGTAQDMTVLWIHEARRVFADRLINKPDRQWFDNCLHTQVTEHFQKDWKEVVGENDRIFYGDYMVPGADTKIYEQVTDMEKLDAIMNEYLEDYNGQTSAPMGLVLFTDAMEHVSRIARIIRQPLGNALLLGVGGSGRQSLTKLATFMAEYQLFMIEVAKGYGRNEWKEDLKRALKMAGCKGLPTVFLFVDTQIVMESFLEDLNNILNTGEVPNLMGPEDKEDIDGPCRQACAAKGITPTPININNMLISRIKQNLHLVLAMSPIGDVFRDRLRMFPSLVNCCTIDWFAEWPEDALVSVAATTLDQVECVGTAELSDSDIRDNLVQMAMYIHKCVEDTSIDYMAELKRKNYVTPTSYLELLRTYETLLAEKRVEVVGLKNRLSVGLDKMITTGQEVAVMQENLVALQPVLEKTQKEVSDMMIVIKEDTEAANKTKEIVAADEAAADAKAAQCKAIADDAQADLDEALPALDAALKSLEKLSKNDIVEVKGMGKPPDGVRLVITAVCIMFEVKPKKVAAPDGRGKVDDYWDVGKGVMNDPSKFLKSLFDYDKENIPDAVIKKIAPHIANPDFTPQAIEKVSKACTSICMWVRAMDKFHHVSRSIEPKRQALESSTAELKVTMDGLAITKAKLQEVVDKLDRLDSEYKEAIRKQQELADKVDDCQKKLEVAHKLLGSLGGEKDRWAMTVEKLKVDEVCLQGDVAIAAGAIAYLGPFTSVYRERIMEQWRAKLKSLGLPHTDGCDLLSVLMDPVEVREWGIQGLPSDNVSTENGIIVKKARRWPLMIDPQGQGNKWIRNKEKDHGLDQIKLTDKDYLRTLENAVRFGRAVLLENIFESLDAALEPILGKQTFKQRGADMIKLGDSVVPYHADFHFYMTTNMGNPHYAPEVSVKVSLLNFMITMDGLQEQLLNIVVAEERPDLAEKKTALVISMAKMKKDMEDIEDEILHLLANSQGNILDDEVLINTLAASKVTSDEIKVKVADAEETSVTIKTISDKYTPVAFRGSILFFCISGLNTVDPMYEYSLLYFSTLFVNGIRNAEPDEDLQARCVKLNDYITYSLYNNVCRSLFEQHKLLFSFLLCVRILQGSGSIDAENFRFLLQGASSMETAFENPCEEWMIESAWIEISNLSKLPSFTGFDGDFKNYKDEFFILFNSATAHTDPLPGPWEEKLTTLQKICVMRTFRPDKVIEGVQLYISEQLGQRFIEPPPFDLPASFADAINMTPLIFVLSKGADPMADVVKFATEMKMNKKLFSISLGQGQGPKAEALISEGMERGSWVLLQNCHLAKSWMTAFDKIVEEFSPDKMHRDFRLWLTSMPSKDFPVSILQNGVKMTVEPPKGLKANIRRTYLAFDAGYLEDSSKPREWRKLVFSISLFHALVQDRRKFGALGWNIPYEFSTIDQQCCFTQIHDFLEDYEVIPYDVMNILCGDVNYGGRVTDDKDRRALMSLLIQYLSPAIMDDDFKFSPSGTYYCPEDNPSPDAVYDYIKDLPINPAPEIFGLHQNADITCAQNEMLKMFGIFVGLGGGGGGGGGGGSEGGGLQEMCERFLVEISQPLNEEDVYTKYPTEYSECMNTVIMQETIRYNNVLRVIHSSCKELIRALKGLVVMSGEMQKASRSLANNQVPGLWESQAYPSLKPLASWVNDLGDRMKFIHGWIDDGAPPTFWMSGFFFPQAFLTGVRQNYARTFQLAVDTIDYDFHLLDKPFEELTEDPEDGCYVYGFYIEGACWNIADHVIDDPRPRELFSEMPVFWLRPVQNRPDSHDSGVAKEAGNYMVPLYKVLTRAGTLSTTGHSTNFVMWMEIPTNRDQEEWIRGGVAMFLSLRN